MPADKNDDMTLFAVGGGDILKRITAYQGYNCPGN
jgi:hypothetical protein